MNCCFFRAPSRAVSVVFLLGFALVAPTVARADAPLLYGITEKGRLSVNGTVLDSLDSDFDPGDHTFGHERWNDLVVDGDTRYVLRRDGLLYKNGKKLDLLPYSPSLDLQWISLAVGDGSVYAIRQDGALSIDGDVEFFMPIADADDNLFAFRQILVAGGDVFGLRADGTVYRNNIDTPVVQFSGGLGVDGLPDGYSQYTVWTAMAISGAGDLLALRTDGQLHKIALDDLDGDEGEGGGDGGASASGEIEAELPFPVVPVAGDFYLDLDVLANDDWVALQADGRIYTDESEVTPLVDYPGNATDEDNVFIDIAVYDNFVYAVRRDGKVYRGDDTELFLSLPKRPYSRIALSAVPPNLDNFKNQKPAPALYKIIALEGEAFSVPVVVTDGDKAADELLVTPVDVPAGAAWDAGSRTLSWDSPGPVGSHVFSVQIDDGVAKAKTFKYKVKVIALDAKPEKNKPPAVSKIKKIQALVGFELSLPVVAIDPDGDDVSLSVNEDKFPFDDDGGATFDSETGVFSWTPDFDHIGKHVVKIQVSDGIKTKKLKLKITVINPLIF